MRCAAPLSWLHVPKCGTSFYSTLLRFACPRMADDVYVGSRRSEEGCPIRGGSIPCAARLVNASSECWRAPAANRVHRAMGAKVGAYAGMFRDPARRLASGRDHRRHNLYGMNARNMSVEDMARQERERAPNMWGVNPEECRSLGETLRGGWAEQRGRAGEPGGGEPGWREDPGGRPAAGGIGALHYAMCPGVRSCQTRMVLGGFAHSPQAGDARPRYPRLAPSLTRHYFRPENACASGRDLALRCDHLQRALERVGRMAFVGVTDRWNPSVCLFHATFGGEPHPTQLRAYRHQSHDGQADVLDERLRDADGWDAALFRRVEALFDARLRLFGIPEEAAPGETYGATCSRALRALEARRRQGGCAAAMPMDEGERRGSDPQAAQAACEAPPSVRDFD